MLDGQIACYYQITAEGKGFMYRDPAPGYTKVGMPRTEPTREAQPSCPETPGTPMGSVDSASLDENIQLVLKHRAEMEAQISAGTSAGAALGTFVWWFYNQVKNSGPWDYKQLGKAYENYGNFNYGAVGSAAGFSKDMLLRLAGWAAQQAGTAEQGPPGSLLEIVLGIGGTAPYGDNQTDQDNTRLGMRYHRRNCWKPNEQGPCKL